MGNDILHLRFSWDRFFNNRSIQYSLVEEGMNEKEAEAISWLVDQHHKGKLLGLGAGLFTAWTWGHWYQRLAIYFPIFQIKPYLKPVIQLGVVVGFTVAGDYFFTGHRHGANHLLSNIMRLNNNLFIKNRQEFVTNFEVLNRKFTAEEIARFNEKREILANPNRKWIFNPHIYDPQEFLSKVERLDNNLAPWSDPQVVTKILEANKDNKNLQLVPFNPAARFDAKGDHLDVRHKFNIGWTPLAA